MKEFSWGYSTAIVGALVLAVSSAGGELTKEAGYKSPNEVATAVASEVSGDWQLVWADEFDGTAIDTSKWTHEVNCWGGGNKERQCYTADPQNSFVQDGFLTIRAIKGDVTGPAWPKGMRDEDPEKAKETKTQAYSSARLNSRGKAEWKYGRMEFRAKLPHGQGTWPALWMLPTDDYYGKWARSGEIDILEATNLGAKCEKCTGGVENQIFGTLHFGDYWPKNTHKGEHVELEDTKAFHTFAVEWKEGEIKWFVDGKHYSTKTPKDWYTASDKKEGHPAAPFDQRFHFIMNLAVGGLWSEEANELGVSPEGYPKDLVIDYVRVYQKKGYGHD